MDTTFLFENNANTNSSYSGAASTATSTNKLASTVDSTNRRFKFKPISENSVFAHKHSQDIHFKLNLNNKKEFQKKLLNFDINRNFDDIYWLSLKQEKPKFSTFCDKNFPKRHSVFNSNPNLNNTSNNNNNTNFQDIAINTSPISTIQILPQPQSQPQPQQVAPQPPPLLPQAPQPPQSQQQQQHPQPSKNNNSGDSTTSKLKTKKFNINDTVSNTAAVLVDLNRQSINLPLTPIKDDFFRNRYFENYLLNRKLTGTNTTQFNSVHSAQLNTIYFKPNFNDQILVQELPIININNNNNNNNNNNTSNSNTSNEATSTSKFTKINNPIKLESIEGYRINIKSEESSPRKTLTNCTNTTSNIIINSTINSTTTISMLPPAAPSLTQLTASQNLLSSKILYKIKEDENISENQEKQQHQQKQEEKKPILGLSREEPIQTQFRLKPLLNSTISMATTANSSFTSGKSLNHILNEELSDHDLDLFDKGGFKKSFPIKSKTKPIKMINQKLPNSGNSEEIASIINANSDLFSAKATSILTTPPLTSSTQTATNASLATTTSTSTSTSTISTTTQQQSQQQQQQAVNPKTKLARIVKTDEDSFLNKKPNKFNNSNSKKTNEENSSPSSEEDTPNNNSNTNNNININNNSNTKANLSKFKSQQQQSVLHYEDFMNYTRVESPHKLGKSMPDGYMFVGSSSIQANSNANTLLNQQFQLFQSQIFDK